MTLAGRKVDAVRQTDNVIYSIREKVAYNINYYGRTETRDVNDAAFDQPIWQIWRVTTDAMGVETTQYANLGKYNATWDDRVSYFPAAPAPQPDPTIGISPSGLNVGGRISQVVLSAVAWTALPPVPLANRNAMAIQNISGTEIKINYDYTGPLPGGYEGVTIASTSERFYEITDNVVIYAKAQAGTPTIQVEEIA